MKSIAYEMELSSTGDNRGSLVAIEPDRAIPFDIARVYYVFDTVTGVCRGQHAHKTCKQILICVSGCCDVICEDSKQTFTCKLNSPTKALYLEGLVWHSMKNFSPGAVLVVLADHVYDERDYIRNYDEFRHLINSAECI